MKMPRTCDGQRWLEKNSKHKMKTWGKALLRGHDMVRRVDPNGETLVWCRKCSGCARCRLEAKLMNRCRSEKKATKEYGNVFSKKPEARRWKGTRQKRTRMDSWIRNTKSFLERVQVGEGGIRSGRFHGARWGCGTVPKRGCWKTEVRYLKKRET